MNSDIGGDLIEARFGHYPTATGAHEGGIFLADDHHHPVLVDGNPDLRIVKVTAVQTDEKSRVFPPGFSITIVRMECRLSD